MEQVKNLLPESLETLTRPTKENRSSTPVLAAFNDFKPLGDQQLVAMLRAANQFARDMLDKKAPYWLSLLGTSGAGKTMLARAITKIFRHQIKDTIISETETRIVRASGGFKAWPILINEVRDGEHRMFQDICDDYFVCLDDIGAEHTSPFSLSKLYQFFNAREKKWTVFTANLSLQQLGDIDTRIASRMIRNGSVVVDVDVPDYNLR